MTKTKTPEEQAALNRLLDVIRKVDISLFPVRRRPRWERLQLATLEALAECKLDAYEESFCADMFSLLELEKQLTMRQHQFLMRMAAKYGVEVEYQPGEED